MALFLKLFGTEGQYTVYTADTANFIKPNVSYVSASTNTYYNPFDTPPTPYSERYLTLDVISGGTILWKSRNSVTKTISYSKNSGITWTEITSTDSGSPINVVAGDKVLLKGTNDQYASGKDAGSCFSGGTAYYNVEGNIMSLISGDSFADATAFTKTWVFHNLFAHSNAVSAKNLILPVMSLTNCCYRAMFSKANHLTEAPELPATTLAASAYTYMFDVTLITKAPDLPAETVPTWCYRGMFENCNNLNYIRCLASPAPATANTNSWVTNVASSGVFVKDADANWTTGNNGIPTNWVVRNDGAIVEPTISFDGFETVILDCESTGATIHYRLNQTGDYSVYSSEITITADTVVEAYSTRESETSITVSQSCTYVHFDQFEYSNRSLNTWTYDNASTTVTVPYSVNAIDGHSSSYATDGSGAKIPFSFETSVNLKEAEPTYLWFEHADQSADIYVDNELVETHWGGYNAFFSDITDHIHAGTNNIKVSLRNKTRSELAPCDGDFNFNATLGYVKMFTSPYVPDKEYGYDGFHITSTVSSAEATINIKTKIPNGATVVCKIDSGSTNVYSAESASTNAEMTFTTTIQNPHLWNGTADPFMYTVTLEVYHDGDLYHRYVRPYGFRYYEYVINDTVKYGTAGNPYTGFLLNGSPYLLRGVCMHSDKDGKANALTSADIASDFNIIQELGCNFIRLAHYPHPKEVYDTCDRLGIVVQTEVPWVKQSTSGQPEAYYTHLAGQYDDMVKQHYNHPCIFFWGLANEISPSTTAFTKAKLEQYMTQIKALDSERLVGFVMSHSHNSPTAFDSPNLDWFGCNLYVGWYVDKTTNNPTNQLNTRVNNFITTANKPLAYSEYGCGGTQRCHSDDPQTTTTKGTNQPRHDIEYQMWLHEGHIEAIKNFPQLMFTAQWQLFDIAVTSRQEGYVVCLDGETTSDDNNLKFLNNKGLVERDHVTKKDTFYLYKAWWNQTDKFVHICGKEYTKRANREIKCYTNDGSTLTMYINGVSAATATVTNNIATFASRTFDLGDEIRIEGATANDTLTLGHNYAKDYLTFSASESGTFKFSGNSIDYSLDSGSTWTTLASNTNTPTVAAGQKIMWKATLTSTSNGIGRFSSTGNFTAEGNIMSLLYGDNFTGQTSLSGNNYVFRGLFYNCTKITSAENLSLPATTLSVSCYNNMFYGCTSLTAAPELPATTLVEHGCYEGMFCGCESLTTAPRLSAMTLSDSCYSKMFSGCTSLTTAPDLPATALTQHCYSEMFVECTSLTAMPVLSATSLQSYCYDNMFAGCTSLTTALVLPATTLKYQCYGNMFSGCTNLATVPSNMLPATTLESNCYFGMFRGCESLTTAPELAAATVPSTSYCCMFQYCTSLSNITCLATNISAFLCTSSWVQGVASSGTFTKAASMSSWTTGDDGIPDGWTVVNA